MVVRSEKRWTTAEATPAVADGIAADYGFSRAMARALVARGLTDRAEIDKFLQPRLADARRPERLQHQTHGTGRHALDQFVEQGLGRRHPARAADIKDR